MTTATGGLIFFVPDSSKNELWGRWQDWPQLVTALDQGPDGIASFWWLVSRGMNVTSYWDWSHGCQNDWKGALRDLHLFPFWVLLLVAFNAPCGPQQDRTRWQALAEAWDALFVNFECGGCPLYDEKVHNLIDDKGGLETLTLQHGESIERGLWRTLKAEPPFCIGRPKCNSNRFFSSTQRAREEVRHWHATLMNYEFLAIEESMLAKPIAKLELRPQAKAATRAAPTAELSLKASCHNAVLVAITMLGDPDHLIYTKIILEFGAAVEQWHRLQSHTLRSVQDSEKWLVSSLQSAFF